jgi:hypothetical protein
MVMRRDEMEAISNIRYNIRYTIYYILTTMPVITLALNVLDSEFSLPTSTRPHTFENRMNLLP